MTIPDVKKGGVLSVTVFVLEMVCFNVHHVDLRHFRDDAVKRIYQSLLEIMDQCVFKLNPFRGVRVGLSFLENKMKRNENALTLIL